MYLKQFVAPILMLCIITCQCNGQQRPRSKVWDFHSATWNMQGSQSVSGVSSWSVLAGILARGSDDSEHISVVALQETGDVPATATQLQTPRIGWMYRPDFLDTVIDEVRLFRWTTGK